MLANLGLRILNHFNVKCPPIQIAGGPGSRNDKNGGGNLFNLKSKAILYKVKVKATSLKAAGKNNSMKGGGGGGWGPPYLRELKQF